MLKLLTPEGQECLRKYIHRTLWAGFGFKQSTLFCDDSNTCKKIRPDQVKIGFNFIVCYL